MHAGCMLHLVKIAVYASAFMNETGEKSRLRAWYTVPSAWGERGWGCEGRFGLLRLRLTALVRVSAWG